MDTNLRKRLAGKVIAIAGGGGIGNGLAHRYAAEGAAVILGDLDAAAAEACAEEIVHAGGRAIGTGVDGTNEASIAALVKQAVADFGGLDGFHANFASFHDGFVNADVLDLPIEIYDEVMGVNARGFVLCTRQAVPALIARGGGAMVYTSSCVAHAPDKVRVAYSMSKAAIHALMRHVAVTYGPNDIRANVIAPGVIMHPKIEAAIGPDRDFKNLSFSHMPITRRLGNPQDIAAMAALLMSDEGAFITGQVLSVDGGGTMRP
jgi:NAD(P)-dependent dehydrogenase (short-subunit alcohol dehydrogenase family)